MIGKFEVKDLTLEIRSTIKSLAEILSRFSALNFGSKLNTEMDSAFTSLKLWPKLHQICCIEGGIAPNKYDIHWNQESLLKLFTNQIDLNFISQLKSDERQVFLSSFNKIFENIFKKPFKEFYQKSAITFNTGAQASLKKDSTSSENSGLINKYEVCDKSLSGCYDKVDYLIESYNQRVLQSDQNKIIILK